jgi:hypothetical protein
MNPIHRRGILRANAIYLLVASTGGLLMDLLGAAFQRGPASKIVAGAPYSSIGFIEAHGLALIFSIWLCRTEPSRAWHFTGAAVHTLLGTCNLVFWDFFPAAGFLWGGYLTTSLHWLFAVLQFSAGIGSSPQRWKGASA